MNRFAALYHLGLRRALQLRASVIDGVQERLVPDALGVGTQLEDHPKGTVAESGMLGVLVADHTHIVTSVS